MSRNFSNTVKIPDISLELSKEKLNAPFVLQPPKNKEALISVQSLTKSFGKGKKKLVAINNVSINFNKNENVALLGANGAGKTTLVEIVAGINLPTSGKVEYHYDYINSFQEGIGIQFQDSSYPVGLKIKNIVEFMVEVYKVKITKPELNEMIENFGLKPFWKKQARSLSGGQQQRLNILLALLHRPKIVFLDELSTGLDISIRSKIQSFVKDYCKKYNINIVLVSHNVEEVELLTDRIIIMQKGVIKVDISKKNAVKKYGSVYNLLKQYI